MNKKINLILYIANMLEKNGIKADFHKVFKILYFAEQKHLAEYGLLISDDVFIAMQNGPVPSETYNIVKSNRFKKYFDTDGFYIITKQKPNLDEISESEQEALNQSIEENKNLSFKELKDKSHDSAWENADINDIIDFVDMVKVFKKDLHENESAYIKCMLENQQIARHFSS